MTVFEDRLLAACTRIGGISADVQAWIDANGQLVGTERISLLHEFHHAETTAKRLAAAVGQRPCVAVVGPARSAKTQTIAGLVAHGGDRLRLRFEGIAEPVDFMRHVLPDAGRHINTMAVRLAEQSVPAPQNFPLEIRLLSVACVVKVLGNAYLTAETSGSTVPSLAQIKEAIDQASARVTAETVPGIGEDDVWDIRTYFATRFGADPTIRRLSGSGFWLALAKLAPNLPNAARADLLSLLWGGLEPFGAAFARLADTANTLNGSRRVHCALNAVLSLEPRSGRFQRSPDNIVCGATLTGFEAADPNTVVVRTDTDVWVSVGRKQLTALAAELCLPLPQGSGGLLQAVDIAEFPPIDGRAGIPDFEAGLADNPALLARTYLGAKAVYLLDRAIAAHEITGLVVCADPSTRSLAEIEGLAARWVELTSGADPAERESRDNALFVALTKIDKAFTEQRPGARQRAVDIPSRIGALLNDSLGRDHAWPTEWTPARAFDSVHLLRNPNFKAKQLCTYSNDGRELGLKAGQDERVQRARAAFLKSDIVRRHVASAASVWDEAFVLNDGGLTYLGQSIVAACDKRVQQRQMVTALNGLIRRMRDRLQRYHLSDNFAHQDDHRHAQALLVVRRLRQCNEQQRLGALLGALQVSDAEIADVLSSLGAPAAEAPHVNGAAAPYLNGGGPATMNGNGHADTTAPSPPPTDTARESSAHAAMLARLAVDHWVETVRKVARSSVTHREFRMPVQALEYLTDELIAGAMRLELETQIAGHIERSGGRYRTNAQQVARAAMFAANSIGEYVMRLGANDVFSNQHPRRKGYARAPIFPPKAPILLSTLDAAGPTPDDELYSDWSQAFVTLVADNAASLQERVEPGEQNDRLGRLLKLLDISL